MTDQVFSVHRYARYAACTLITGLALNSIAAQATPSEQPLATGRILRRACLDVVDTAGKVKATVDSAGKALAAFCTPKLTLAVYNRYETDNLPSLQVIRQHAENVADSLTSVPAYDWEQKTVDNAGASGSQPTSPFTWETQAAFSLESVIQARAAEEFRLFVWAKAKDRVCGPELGALLFPNTCDVLNRPDLDVSAVIGGGTLQELLRQDVPQLPVRTLTLVANTTSPTDVETADRVLAARYATALTLDLVGGMALPTAMSRLSTLPSTPRFSWSRTPVASWVAKLALLATSSGAGNGDLSSNWAGGGDVAGVYNARAYIINLLSGYPLSPTGSAGKLQCKDLACHDLPTLAAEMTSFVDGLKGIRDSVTAIHAAATEKERVDRSVRLVGIASTELLDQIERANPKARLTETRADLAALQSVYLALSTGRYAAAVTQTIQLAERANRSVHISPDAIRLVGVAAQLAEAKDQAAMTTALDNFVAPPNRFLRKRDARSGSYFMINSYLGVGAAGERACVGLAQCSGSALSTGVSLPIGLEVGTGTGHRPVTSIGMLFQMLDLGAVASWRVADIGPQTTDVQAEPQIGLSQLISPGAYLVLGIGATPFTIGLGGSIAPKLRTLASSVSPGDRAAVRFPALFLAMDIPLFP